MGQVLAVKEFAIAKSKKIKKRQRRGREEICCKLFFFSWCLFFFFFFSPFLFIFLFSRGVILAWEVGVGAKEEKGIQAGSDALHASQGCGVLAPVFLYVCVCVSV